MVNPKRRIPVACLNCDTIRELIPSVANRPDAGKFCCRTCQTAYRRRGQFEGTCTTCDETKTAEHFDRNPQAPDRLRSECKVCRRARSRAYYARTKPDRVAQKLFAQFGLSVADVTAQLEAQGGVCAICGTADPGNGFERLVIDHDHTTGQFRGLLCASCNSGLGQFRDNPTLLLVAIDYLSDPPAQREEYPDDHRSDP